jgi:Mrp family chromosome partitioning ATPase
MRAVRIRDFRFRRTRGSLLRQEWMTRSRVVLDSELQRSRARDIIRDVQRAALARRQFGTAVGRPALTIGVTSPRLGDGKTTVAMAIANSLAQDFEGTTTLVDADFETHSIATEFGIGAVAGLVEVLAGTASPEDVTHVLPERGPLRIVSAGVALERSPRLVRSDEAKQRLGQLGADNAFLVFDLPAAIGSANAPLLAQHCDVVIVVARTGRTTKRELALTLDRLSDSNVMGVVLNRWSSRVPPVAERWLGLGR